MNQRLINLVLAGLVLVAGGVFVWAILLDPPGDGTKPDVNQDSTYVVGSLPDDDEHDAVVAAVETAEVALGWDYRKLDQGLDAATSRMTDELVDGKQGFRATFDAITRPRAKANKSVVDALIRGAGAVKTDDGRVTVLLFVDQAVVDRKTAQNPTVPYQLIYNRVLMDVVRVDGEWLVDDIRTVSND